MNVSYDSDIPRSKAIKEGVSGPRNNVGVISTNRAGETEVPVRATRLTLGAKTPVRTVPSRVRADSSRTAARVVNVSIRTWGTVCLRVLLQ